MAEVRKEDVEVTEEMIEAGVSELKKFDGRFETHDFSAERAYEAMVRVKQNVADAKSSFQVHRLPGDSKHQTTK